MYAKTDNTYDLACRNSSIRYSLLYSRLLTKTRFIWSNNYSHYVNIVISNTPLVIIIFLCFPYMYVIWVFRKTRSIYPYTCLSAYVYIHVLLLRARLIKHIGQKIGAQKWIPLHHKYYPKGYLTVKK